MQAIWNNPENDKNGRKSNKRQGIDIPPPAEPISITKIIDLNDDCLVRTLKDLDLRSLFNVAVASEWLRPAAADVYKRRFGTEMVHIHECEKLQSDISYHTSEQNNYIYMYGLKTSLLFLRCFGSSISRLSVEYRHSRSNRYSYMLQYINNYCTKSLTSIEFNGMPNVSIEQQFQKVFANVKNLQVNRGSVGEQWPSFAKCFPNLHRFGLCSSATSGRFIEKSPFPFLEHLSVFNIECNGFTKNQLVAYLLNGAHQLKSLVIYVRRGEPEIKISTLLDLIQDKPLIIKLALLTDANIPVKRIIDEHPALIELYLSGHEFTADDIIAFFRQFSSLKKFEFWNSSYMLYTRLLAQLNEDEWKISGNEFSRHLILENLNR